MEVARYITTKTMIGEIENMRFGELFLFEGFTVMGFRLFGFMFLRMYAKTVCILRTAVKPHVPKT